MTITNEFKHAFLCGLAYSLGICFAAHRDSIPHDVSLRIASANDAGLWNSDLHPRKKDGKFAKKGEGNSDKPTASKEQEANTPEERLRRDLGRENLLAHNGENFSDSLEFWSGEECTNICAGQKLRLKGAKENQLWQAADTADALEEFIDIAPKFKGKVYRGMALPEETIQKIKEGKPFGLGSLSSWSEDKKVANKFATSNASDEEGLKKVVLTGDVTKQAISIEKYLTYPRNEREVLMSSKARFKAIKNHNAGGVLYIEVKQL